MTKAADTSSSSHAAGPSSLQPERRRRRIEVAYLGPKGTYSHQAAEAVFAKFRDARGPSRSQTRKSEEHSRSTASNDAGEATEETDGGDEDVGDGHGSRKFEVTFVPCKTITEAFIFGTDRSEALSLRNESTKEANSQEDEETERYAVIPIANSSNGPVKESMARFGLSLEDDVPGKTRMQPGLKRRSKSGEADSARTTTREESDDKVFTIPESGKEARVISGTELAVSHALLVSEQDYAALRELSKAQDEQPRKKRKTDDGTEEANGHIQKEKEETEEDDQLPLDVLSRIGEVASHEQALGQCSQFLSKHVANAKRLPITSTALSAERLTTAETKANGPEKESEPSKDSSGQSTNSTRGTKRKSLSGKENENGKTQEKALAGKESAEQQDPETVDNEGTVRAGIASEFAAQIYGVRVARREIQNANDNTTRFICVTSEKDHVFLI